MNGQGRPPRSSYLSARLAGLGRWTRYGLLALICWLPTGNASSDSLDLRLRIEWGGLPEQAWQGRVEVPAGRLVDPLPLGIEADEPASMWIDPQGQLRIQARSPRVYDGVDVTVQAPRDAVMRLALDPSQPTGTPVGEVSLAKLVDGEQGFTLPGGQRLVVRRAPGDRLRVRSDRPHLVFAPQETWDVEVEPHALGHLPGTRLRLQARLVDRAGREPWVEERDWIVPAEGSAAAPLALRVPLPASTGVYEMILTVSKRAITERFGLRAVGEERRVQVVVVDPTPISRGDESWRVETLLEIDPTSPGWWERWNALSVNWTRVAPLRRGSTGNGTLTVFEHPLGKLASLGPGGREPDTAWEAFPLPIARPGQPHILEVEFPSNVPQSLGISVVEPNAAGVIMPIGLDSGVYVGTGARDQVPTLERHRLIFWPRTTSPIALLTNRRHGSPPVFGRLRLLGPRPALLTGLSREPPPQHLPRLFPFEPPHGRSLIAYFDRPLFPESFGAAQGVDPRSSSSGRTLDDWQTFLEAGERLLEYLHHAGYDTLLMNVAADGSSLYPNRQQPTPRYDDGVFFSTGIDPQRKDVVELLARLCDREGIRFIPALQFAAPLPALEALKRRGDDESAGIEPVGIDGAPWLASQRSRHGLAPYYNPLDPRVQDALVEATRELLNRVALHPSFAGLGWQLSADGYLQLPGVEWGLDRATLRRFCAERKLEIPLETPADRDAAVAIVLGREREAWLAWRARTLHTLHERVAAEIAAAHPGARLHILPGDVVRRPDLERVVRPQLPRRRDPRELLLDLGLDPGLSAASREIVWMRPWRMGPLHDLHAAGPDLEWNQSAGLDEGNASRALQGALFFHPPQETRLASFDAQQPTGQSLLRLVAQPSPGGMANRQRFVHALAVLDAPLIVEGGWMLPRGQEESLRDLIAAYRHLPAERFQTLAGESQPVVVRTYRDEQRTFLYLVNDSPWKAIVQLDVDAEAGSRLDPLGATRRFPTLPLDGQGQRWTIDLAPYDLVAGVINDPRARLTQPLVRIPPLVAEGIERELRQLWQRAATLAAPPLLNVVENADFEIAAGSTRQPDHWELRSPSGGGAAKLDASQRHGGHSSLHLSADAQGVQLVGSPFLAPRTGRLSIAAWVRTSDAQPPPLVRLGVVDEGGASPWSRHQSFSTGSTNDTTRGGWTRHVLLLDEWPSTGSGTLRVSLELPAAGEAWIDDVELSDLEFSEAERLELSKRLTLIEYQFKQGEWRACAEFLDSYWARFLREYVALDEATEARLPDLAQPDAEAPPERRTGWFDRMKRFVPRMTR